MTVMINISDKLYTRIQRLAEETERNIEDMLGDDAWLDTLFLPEMDDTPLHRLEDEAVLALADSHMNPLQNARLTELQYQRKFSALSAAEQKEYDILFAIYRTGELRMAEALVEATQRGLEPERLKPTAK